ncbi:hypothetical protein E6O75_ATG04754 [Venturia nashicola]|uniref:Uncharacterized protein n=1 Tax=Venturia nashicola TaxID=86259 RepID=A0A4Z1PHP8_9PEZI|nr:hypothetical protein E6O75_ATG04754 [Venturia nashicola]
MFDQSKVLAPFRRACRTHGITGSDPSLGSTALSQIFSVITQSCRTKAGNCIVIAAFETGTPSKDFLPWHYMIAL